MENLQKYCTFIGKLLFLYPTAKFCTYLELLYRPYEGNGFY